MKYQDIVSIQVELLNDDSDRAHSPGATWAHELAKQLIPKDARDREDILEDVLSTCFHECNHLPDDGSWVTRTKRLCRSMSVGDLVHITLVNDHPTAGGMMGHTTRHFRCEPCGWVETDPIGYRAFQRVARGYRSFRADWLKEKGIIAESVKTERVA